MTGTVTSVNDSISWQDRFRRQLLGGGPNTVVTIGACEMPRGTYYVGDLTHVLDTETWEGLHRVRNDAWGKFVLDNGRIVVIYNLPSNGYRKRQYKDLEGRVYGVDSGTIGITLARGLESEYGDKGIHMSPELPGEDWHMTITRLANIVRYNDQFECDATIKTVVRGNIFGGDCEVALIRLGTEVCIDTDESYDNDTSETESDNGECVFGDEGPAGPIM